MGQPKQVVMDWGVLARLRCDDMESDVRWRRRIHWIQNTYECAYAADNFCYRELHG